MTGWSIGRRALALIAVIVAGYAWQIEPRWLRVRRLTLRIAGLPPAFEGYRIVHLSDLHLGVRRADRALPEVIAAVRREQADLIAITGDFATKQRPGWRHALPMLRPIGEARAARDGAWAVLGNHDHHAGPDEVAARLDDAGIRLLSNRHQTIWRGPAALVLAGINDMIYSRPDLDRALVGRPPDAPVILLAHEPDFAPIAARDRRIALQLSGHTHGGQVRLPGLPPPLLPLFGRHFSAGWYRVGEMQLYVTHGTGTGRFVYRFNCRPEIATITLTGDIVPEPAERPPARAGQPLFHR